MPGPLWFGWLSPLGLQTCAYLIVYALILVFTALPVLFRENEFWKQVLFTTVVAIVVPYVSGDYTLIHMYFPLIFFMNSRRVSRFDLVYVALFTIPLIPMAHRYFEGTYQASISVVIYPIALCILVLLSIIDRAPQDEHSTGPSNHFTIAWRKGPSSPSVEKTDQLSCLEVEASVFDNRSVIQQKSFCVRGLDTTCPSCVTFIKTLGARDRVLDPAYCGAK